MKHSVIGRTVVAAVFAAAIALLPVGVSAGQTQQTEQRLSALEEMQKAILKELLEIKAMLQRPAAPTPPALPAADLSITDAAVRGDAKARLTVIEFSDFECPFCGRYTAQTYGQLDREYVGTGKIRYVFRHFPLTSIHPNAMKAAEAGECARLQNKFWEYHDRLFANQELLGPANLVEHAQALNLNVSTFQQCLSGQATAKVRQDLTEGAQAGMTGTPTFFIGTMTKEGKVHVLRKLVGAQPFANFKAVLDELLGANPAGGS